MLAATSSEQPRRIKAMERQEKISPVSLAVPDQIRFEDMSNAQRDILFCQLLSEKSGSGGYKYKKAMHGLTALLFAVLGIIIVFTFVYAVSRQRCFANLGLGSLAVLFAISFWIQIVQKQYSIFLQSKQTRTTKG